MTSFPMVRAFLPIIVWFGSMKWYHIVEESLGHIEDVSARLAETHQELQKEVDSLQAELKVNQNPERMSIIQEMISVGCSCIHIDAVSRCAEPFLLQDLLGQMSRIREKATESEAVVRDITKDIQVLDLAKKNLITTMTMMKRLQMLGKLLFPHHHLLSQLFMIQSMH